MSHFSSNPIDTHLGSYGFRATSEDKISSLYAFNIVKDYSYDLTFEAKSKVLLNGGNGVITIGQGCTNSTEWAIPALKTNGTFSVGKEKFQVDAAKSFTWYDTQAGNDAPRSWTWFQLHFPGTAIKASILGLRSCRPSCSCRKQVCYYSVWRRGPPCLALYFDRKYNERLEI